MKAKIADIVFQISSDQPLELIHLEQSYRNFLCTEDAEITLFAKYDGLPQISLHDKDRIFDSEMIWSLYRIDAKNVFVMKLPALDMRPYRIAVFDTDFKRGVVYNYVTIPEHPTDGCLPNPLEFPLSEVLMVSLLSKGRGLMVHSCGIDDKGKGYLFAGNSTHGKTTMARLWTDEALTLNDDRIVIRYKEGRFWMYGTPWHGDYTGVSPKGVPVEKLFFLQHAMSNNVIKRNGADAASMFLTRCFPPLWDDEGMRFTLDLCSKLVEIVPCYTLDFRPDKSIIDFVRCAN
ncbi:MAG: hypothetical protein A2Y66_04460 [Nitrospirae bacterium RBG_13_41_22]|nr:MAG: hypothetical protein A2Y66_04460 [Nitrospirae bacterium RBG_13_41_22]